MCNTECVNVRTMYIGVNNYCSLIHPVQVFKMWNFFIIIGILLLIDIAYLGFWTGLYPFRRNVKVNEVHCKCMIHVCITWVGGMNAHVGYLSAIYTHTPSP